MPSFASTLTVNNANDKILKKLFGILGSLGLNVDRVNESSRAVKKAIEIIRLKMSLTKTNWESLRWKKYNLGRHQEPASDHKNTYCSLPFICPGVY